MLSFFQHLNSLHPVSPETQANLIRIVRQKELRRNQVWLQQGAICDKLAFVEKGLAKLYFEIRSKELILDVFKENSWMLAAGSYCNQEASLYAIRITEPANVYYFEYKDLMPLLERSLDLGVVFAQSDGDSVPKS